MKLALNNGKAFIKGKLVKASILVEKGVIKKISAKKIRAEREIDCAGKIILPGAIDVHVHFRVPGAEQKEDWFSGSLAALHGGVTTVMDMPNNSPATTTVKLLEEKRALATAGALVNFDLYMAATGENLGEIAKAPKLRGVKLYFGSTTGNILLNSDDKILELFRLAEKNGFVVVVHAEDEETTRENARKYAGNENPEVHARIRSAEAEAKAIKKILSLQMKAGNKVHIAHLSSAQGLKLIEKAKKGKHGKQITCEAAPHHLFLDSADYKKLGNLMKCNPSIKSAKDRKALWKGLVKGTIDIVATDHAPHTLAEKSLPYSKAPAGIPGLETMLPLLLNAVNEKKITLKRVVNVVAERPAEIFGWKKKGFIRKGFDADLTIAGMNEIFRVENGHLFTKAGYSPFTGKRFKGKVGQTIVRGNVYG